MAAVVDMKRGIRPGVPRQNGIVAILLEFHRKRSTFEELLRALTHDLAQHCDEPSAGVGFADQASDRKCRDRHIRFAVIRGPRPG
jgi:hypothetical protein